ncbi:MAG: hypothetical protein VR67_10005 [Peptococcaceae bacterium BRH_c8a]|nr:MAG: hypothetical protein VR67_10005 [Peptococcaceae bacterium BRH_c8a]
MFMNYLTKNIKGLLTNSLAFALFVSFILLVMTILPQGAQAAESSIWKMTTNNNSATGYGDNIGRSVSTFGGTGAIAPSSSSYSSTNYLYVYANNWADGAGTKGFKIEVKTINFTNITISYAQTSDDFNGTNIGPRDFKLQYSLDDVNYYDVTGGAAVLGNGWGEVVTKTDLQLPATCDNVNSVYLRWIMTSNTGVNGKTITTAGEAELANIDVEGIAMPVAPSDITLSNNILVPDSPSGTPIGTFSVTDFNTTDTHTLTLVGGEGSTDNTSFQIVGNELRSAGVLSQGTYSIRVNANDGTYDFAKVFSIIVDIVYPDINGFDQTWDYITNVTFNTINNTTVAESGGYGDYTAVTTSVTRGQSYDLIVTNPPTEVIDPAYPQYIKAWIDWNHDGDFNDAGEAFEVAGNLSTQLNSQISIIVPADAAITTTRMRVVIWGTDITAFPPNAGSFDFGEAEDYSIEIVDVLLNTAPSLDVTAPSMGSTDEDTTTSPILISDYLGSVTDPDPGALSGVAISSVTGNGTWQYSLDGSTWSAVGAVSDTSALLLRSTDSIRYIPDGTNGETVTITYRAWDQTSGVPGDKADTTTNGGSTAFSANTGTVTLTVASVNDAPTITGLPADVTVTEDTASNLDLSVTTFSDVDAGANPVTLTLTADSGTITSASGGGVTVSGSGTSILTLTGTPANIDTFLNTVSNIQYQGALNLYGNDADTITLVANDGGNSGSGGGTDVTLGSVNADITAVNDAPTVAGTYTLDPTDEDTTSTGVRVSTIMPDLSGSDVDGNPLGAAITAWNGNGTWQYSTEPSTWSDVGSVSDTSALLLSATTWLRYVPDGQNGETAGCTFRAWDQTVGTASGTGTPQTVNTTTNGGTSAYSANTGTVTLTVTSVNDPPVTSFNTITVIEDSTYTFTAADFNFTDVDTGDTLQSVLIDLLPGAGTLALNGVAVSAGDSISVSDINSGLLTFTPAADAHDPFYAEFGFRVSDGTALSNYTTILIDVQAVNDAPAVTAPASITVAEDIASPITGISFADVDAWSGELTTTFTVDSGTLSAVSTSEVTVGGTSTTRTLTGKLADINSFIAAGGLTYTTAQNMIDSVTLGALMNDKGNTGSGGAKDSQTAYVTLTVTPTNDPPSLDLNGPGGSDSSSAIFCAGGYAVNISPDATLTEMDLGDDIVSLTAVLEATPDSADESLSLNASATAAAAGLTVSYNAGTGMLSITGAASPATYETILCGIVYHNAANPAFIFTGTRTISVYADDGESISNIANSMVAIVTAPITDLGGDGGSSDTSASFTEGGGSIFVAPDATIGDPDNDNLNQLIIQLTNPQDGTAESINISGYDNGDVVSGITITYNSATRITMTGVTTATDYQALLRQLTYNNTSEDPDATSWTITAQARDINGYFGPIATATVSVMPVNDAPMLTANTGATLDEGATVTLTNTMLGCSDPDNTADQLTYTVSQPPNGSLMLNDSPLTGGTFTQNDIDNNRVAYAHDGSESPADSFTFTVTDGTGGNISNTTFAITVNPVNDVPVIVVNQELALAGGNTVTIGNDYLAASDADNNPGQLTYTINIAPASGTLYNNGSAIPAGGTFTQLDIDYNLVTYTHDNSETTADSFSFTVTDGAGGSVSGTFDFSIEPTVINPDTSGMSFTTGSVAADGTATATITVVVKNVNAIPLAGHTITLDQGSGSSIISPTSSVTSAEGKAEFTVKSDRAETVTYTAYDQTDNQYITQTVQVTFEPGITVTPTSGSAVEGQSMQYEVAIVSQPTADVVISASCGGQLELDNDSLTFTPANYSVPQSVIVTAFDNDVAEGPHSATVSHSVYSADAEYNNYDMADVTVTIMDNDSPGISIIQSSGSTQVSEAGGHDIFDLVLTTRPADSVTVSVYGDRDVDVSPETVIFAPGNWNVLQSVTVTAVDDNTVEFAHTGTVTYAVYSPDPDYNGFLIPDLVVQVTDNDLPSIASLAGLVISSGTLTPAFDPAVTSYTASVPNGVSSLTVTATPQDGAATVKINNQPIYGGQSGPIALNVGDNTITVLVTAQDNSTTEEYVITVRRAASSGGSSGSGRDSGNVTPPADGTNESIKSDSGGTVSLDRVTVDIPPDALPAEATVSITKLTTSEATKVVPAGLRVKMASDVYEITTSGERQFGDNTITIKIAYDPAKAAEGEYPAIHYYDETLGQWVKLKTEHVEENGTWYAVTRVNHLTKFTVFSVPEEERRVITLTIGQIQASVNNSPYTLDAAPYVDQKAGRTLVPLRFVSEALGADVKWDAATQQVTILNGDRTITITLNSNRVLVDGQSQEIDCAPVVLPPGRTFVPLRFVSETLGSQVEYNAQTKQVTISGINR